MLFVRIFAEIYSIMFMTRFFGRTLLAAAKSETSAGAAAATTTSVRNPLEEFFEVERSQDEDKPIVYGTNISNVSY